MKKIVTIVFCILILMLILSTNVNALIDNGPQLQTQVVFGNSIIFNRK